MNGYLLPLVELYVRGNPAARDFLTRMDEDFRPPGISGNVLLATEYRQAKAAQNFPIDDFQTQTATGTSSSGGNVTFDVSNVTELLMSDQDGSFDWSGSQSSNGMTRSRFSGDDERCVVFDWTLGETAFYELQIVPTQRDFSDNGFLSFRAAQGTRHPETVALDGPLSFHVTLRDADGHQSTIAISNYGHITPPYQRSGFGSGLGWANEFSTVRIRLTDFLTNDGDLDLTNIAALRFDFGAGFGSIRGRIGLDDSELTDHTTPSFELTLGRDGDGSALNWSAAPGAVTFNVYRGTIPPGGFSTRGTGDEVYDHLCWDAGDAAGDGPFFARDATAVPANDAGFYYLVATVTQQGEQADPFGRPYPSPCPLP